MEVVAEVGNDDDLVEAVGRTRPDVVVASMPATEPTEACRRLMAEATRLRVVAFSPPDAAAAIELVPHEKELGGDMSPRTLVDEIRGANS